ncbi:hypothetical protein [Planococcus antarcticus]|nr:hypothetical protein [Planococcus antarcticus]
MEKSLMPPSREKDASSSSFQTNAKKALFPALVGGPQDAGQLTVATGSRGLRLASAFGRLRFSLSDWLPVPRVASALPEMAKDAIAS